MGYERDLVGVRTIHRREAVHLYRLNTSPDDARRLLLVYLDRIKELADRPGFYHLLTKQLHDQHRALCECGRIGRLDIRHVLNGLADSYLYIPPRPDRHDASV